MRKSVLRCASASGRVGVCGLVQSQLDFGIAGKQNSRAFTHTHILELRDELHVILLKPGEQFPRRFQARIPVCGENRRERPRDHSAREIHAVEKTGGRLARAEGPHVPMVR